MNPQQVADRIEIQAALTRYATGVDSKNWDLWRSVFTEDADVDYTQSTPLRGTPGEVAEWYAQNFTEATVPWSMHYVTNVEITFISADEANVVAMFYNPCQLGGMTEPSFFGGYYHHEFVRTSDGWKSKHLVEQMFWRQNMPTQMRERTEAGS
jgi:hypothetical protein